jgi:hypothetical protein
MNNHLKMIGERPDHESLTLYRRILVVHEISHRDGGVRHDSQLAEVEGKMSLRRGWYGTCVGSLVP